jgi:hypothetical protein
MQRTTTVSLGLFAAWACHDLEELFTMRETSRVVAARMPDWVPIPDDVRRDGLSQQHVNLGISLMGAYLAGVSAVGVRSRGRSRLFRSALLGLRPARLRSHRGERRPAPIHHRRGDLADDRDPVLALGASRTRPRGPFRP